MCVKGLSQYFMAIAPNLHSMPTIYAKAKPKSNSHFFLFLCFYCHNVWIERGAKWYGVRTTIYNSYPCPIYFLFFP